VIVRSLGRGARAGIVVSAALALLVLFAPPPADASSRSTAAAGGNSVQLLEVNSADANNVQVVFRYDGPASDVSKVGLTENGKPTQPSAATSLADAKRAAGVVVVLDTSASSDGSGSLAAGRAAIKALLAKLSPGTQVALVAAGSDVLLAQRFTTDHASVETAMNTLTPAGDGALWEGVARAADQLEKRSPTRRSPAPAYRGKSATADDLQSRQSSPR